MPRPYRKPADRANRAPAPVPVGPGTIAPDAPQDPRPLPGEVAVRPDGRHWAIVTSEPLPYNGHRRPAGDRHAGLYAYPYSSEQSARNAAERTGRVVIK